MHRVAIATWAGVDANVLALNCEEAVENFNIQIHEDFEEIRDCPWLARIVFAGKSTFGEVDGYTFCTGFETATDVFFAFIH